MLVLEKTNFPGGMASTKELFSGYRHSVGAWAFIVYHDEMLQKLELEKYGFELLTPYSSFCVFGDESDTPFVAYNDMDRMAQHISEDHGPDALEGLMGLYDYLYTFNEVADEYRFKVPDPIDEIIAREPDANRRKVLLDSWYGSVVDLVRKFFPDPTKHRTITGSMAAMAIDSTRMGPYSPGSAASLLYHYTRGGVANLFRMPKGGIGTLSDALVQRFEDHGGKVEYKTQVKKLLVENGKTVGVELRNGEQIRAKAVMSSLDARTTFMDLAGEDNLPDVFVRQVKEIDYRNGYMQIHLTLDEAPEPTGQLEFTMENDVRWLLAYIRSPEHVSDCWESYQRGEIPEDPLSYCYIPSLIDPSVAPDGKHAATLFSHYFPYDLPKDKRKDFTSIMADRVIDQIAKVAPNFKGAINDRVVFTQDYFGKTLGITDGDFGHGLLHPGQMWEKRPVAGYADYRTPLAGC